MSEEKMATPKLEEYYKAAAKNVGTAINLGDDFDVVVQHIGDRKACYTVLITSALYKILHPEQDIRQHKIDLPNGYSGRIFDEKYVTPFLSAKKLPSMAQSGWLTRSFEQDYPYDENFNGMISPKKLKDAFIEIVTQIENSQEDAKKILLGLLQAGIEFRENNKVEIQKLDSTEITIDEVTSLLKNHFTARYQTRGAAKLPVLAFHAIYSMIVPEMQRYDGCKLLPLGSHTACDANSKSAGDVEVARSNGDGVFEALEIKLDRPITPQIVQVAYEKVCKFQVERYYILSGVDQNIEDVAKNNQLILEIRQEHGCQLIINGLYQSLKYYLRLVSSPTDFLDRYIAEVGKDTEIQAEHKQKLNELLSRA